MFGRPRPVNCLPLAIIIYLMIAKIQGVLDAMEGGSALVAMDQGVVYEVLVPAYAQARLTHVVGQPLTLHTKYYFESQNQGATMIPRLAGFLTPEDRAFFELFTTCKGIGYRKALRAMTLTTEQIAAAVADRDVTLLQSLPEVGRRTAETIVASLRGKVDPFVSAAAYGERGGGPVGSGAGQVRGPGVPGVARDALEALLRLGENRAQAITWIDRALADEDNRPTEAEQLIARVYQIKAGV